MSRALEDTTGTPYPPEFRARRKPHGELPDFAETSKFRPVPSASRQQAGRP